MALENHSSDYRVSVKDGRLFVENIGGFKEAIDSPFWKKIMYERYLQLENGEKPLFNSPTPQDKYTVLKGELKKGIIYEGKLLEKKFDDTSFDFMLGKENGLLVLRQVNGHPFTEDDIINNNFILSHIKSSRLKQIDHTNEELPRNADINKYVDEEIKRGIILNGIFISPDKILGSVRRDRRARRR